MDEHTDSPPHKAYDIRNTLLRAETKYLLHKNAVHTGDRYCIVMYNKNLNYSNSSECTRSCEIQKQPMVETSFLPTVENEKVILLRKSLLDVLEKTRFPQDRGTKDKPHSKYGDNYGYFVSFGITTTRKARNDRTTRKSYNVNNLKYPVLYNLFCEYINALHPHIFGEDGVYHACIIAKNSMCMWHRDKTNIGHATLSGLGSYTGGELLLEDYIECKKDRMDA